LRLERGLVGNVVVEVVASDVNDDLTRAAVVRLLTLDARRLELHRALFAILTSLTGSFIRLHVLPDGVDVVGDDRLAVIASRLAFDLTDVVAFSHELRLKRALVGNVVVVVVAGDVNDRLARTAVAVSSLTLHALDYFYIRALHNILACLTGTFIGAHVSENLVNIVVDEVRAVLTGVRALRLTEACALHL